MTYTTLIKIAPITTLERVNDPNLGPIRQNPLRPRQPDLLPRQDLGAAARQPRREPRDRCRPRADALRGHRRPLARRGRQRLQPTGMAEARCPRLVRVQAGPHQQLRPVRSAKGLRHRGVGLERGRRTCGASSRGDDVARPAAKPKPAPTVIRRNLPPAARCITPDDELEEYLRRVDFYGPDVPAELIIENMKRELQAIRRRR